MEDASSDNNGIDKKSINSLIRKTEGLKKILNKAEFLDVKQQLIQLESKFDLSCRARLMGVSIPTYRKKIKELNVSEEKEINRNQG